jgi:lysophospholipase L1-like esterase
MAFATAYLKSHPKTRLVTLTLGANDLFRWQKDCAVSATTGTCPLGFLGVLGVMRTNLSTIFSELRGAGYSGLIVAVTYYALDYRDTSIGVLLNAQMIAAATSHGAFIASGLEAWRATATAAGGSSCVAGLLIRTSPTACDVHPTPLGRDLLAGAVIDTLATTCSANSAAACIDKDND